MGASCLPWKNSYVRAVRESSASELFLLLLVLLLLLLETEAPTHRAEAGEQQLPRTKLLLLQLLILKLIRR